MNFVLRLSDKEVDYLFNVLAQRPFGEVAQLIGTIKMQIDEQNAQRIGGLQQPMMGDPRASDPKPLPNGAVQ